MRLAIVYDRVNKWGGAERVLLTLHEIWPEAPLYTAVYNSKTTSWAKVFEVKSSFLQYLPFAKSKHEFYPVFTPFAFESFDFSSFDVVLSITSAEAKGIITKPSTLHICYCLTPTRYLWSGYDDYFDEPGVGILNPLARVFMKVFTPSLRAWDLKAAKRPNFYLAISENVKKRIKKYYQRDAEVIYPSVDTDKFKLKNNSDGGETAIKPPRGWQAERREAMTPPMVKGLDKRRYFLIVSRLVPYKKIDYTISAFNKLGWKLKIIGNGIDEVRLKSLAGRNIEFLGEVEDSRLISYYQNCQALIFPQEEDFGLTPIEAQACGKPVVAYNGGGAKESVVSGKTGELYDSQTEDSLISAFKRFQKSHYSSSACRKNALRFSKDMFKKKMKEKVEKLWNDSRKKL